MTLGKRISILRKNNNLSQQDLANKLFVTNKTISSWETNRTEPSLEMIMKLSNALNCSTSYLIFGNIEKNEIETEIKIKLNKAEFCYLDIFLQNHSIYINESKHNDTYYQPKHRHFISEWLRISQRGNKKTLNYKKWHDFHYDEYEVEIDDIENLDKILTVLDFKKLVVVNKTRKKYMYLDKYEIVLDIVDELGYYVEVKVNKYNQSIPQEYDGLLKIAKSLNLNLDHIDKKGYPYHLLNKEVK